MKKTPPRPRTLRSQRILTPDGLRPADLILRGGRIEAVLEHGTAEEVGGKKALDLGDLVLMPSAIDVHVHINEPGREHWEGFESAGRAAAAGGIGLLVDMPLNSEPVTTTLEALEEKIRCARKSCCVDVAFYAGIVPENADDEDTLTDLSRAGVAGFKCFLCDSGIEDFPPLAERELRQAMEHVSETGGRLLAHAEIVDPNHTPTGPPHSYSAYLASRPPTAELRGIELLLRLSGETDCPIHIVHLATEEALSLLSVARQAGADVTIETCPHYLTFTAEEIPDGETLFKCAPPIRDRSNREELWRGLGDGTIDFVASDHSPCPPHMKELQHRDLRKAWGGISSLQLLLPALWTEARERGHSLERLSEWISRRPATWLGLPDRGVIEAGARADLVAWDPDECFSVVGAELEHKHAETPYEGRQLFGTVARTWVEGEQVWGEVSNNHRGSPVRIRGGLSDQEQDAFGRLQNLSTDMVHKRLTDCCGSPEWVDTMIDGWPYRDARSLFIACEGAFDRLSRGDWLEAFVAHPRIGDRAALRGAKAARSALERAEQAGTAAADEETLQALLEANNRYEDRFGFIFLICARGKDARSLLAELERRLENDEETEFATACEEQRKITVLRMQKLLVETRPQSQITTHVLDTSTGKPAAGLNLVLERRSKAGGYEAMALGTTDQDGRVAELGPEKLEPGFYRLVFQTGDYNKEGFYPEVIVSFKIEDVTQHYHVPLLLSPFGYSTYRGS